MRDHQGAPHHGRHGGHHDQHYQGGRQGQGAPSAHPSQGSPSGPGGGQQRYIRQRREVRAATAGTPIVVDGSNIAWLECTADGKPRLENILKVRDALTAKGFAPIIICDAALYHQVGDPQQLNQLIDAQVIQQAPAQTDADYFVLETADRLNAQVVSDDQYKPYLDRYAWIPERRVPVMIVAGLVEFYEEKLEEPEPNAPGNASGNRPTQE